MANGIVRKTDISKGHNGYPPMIAVNSSDNSVLVNGLPVMRENDKWNRHCKKSCHSGYCTPKNHNVFIGGKMVMVQGDPLSCGDHAVMGSPNVLIGG